MKKTTYAAIKMNIYLKDVTSKGDGLSHFRELSYSLIQIRTKKGLKRVS